MLRDSVHKPRLTMREVGERPKDIVDKGTKFIKWSLGSSDFHLLKKSLALFGHEVILGDPFSCELALIPAWRTALPAFRTWRLDVAFPAIFPGTPLVGTNHHVRSNRY